MRFFPVIVSAACVFGGPAQADDLKATATIARHHTSNALDSPIALDDWYTVLRGAIETSVGHDLGTTKIRTEGELKRFDNYSIEDDYALGISAETTTIISERLELRGTLSVNLIDEGDDLDLGDVIVGIRTARAIFAGGLQAGVRLSPDTVLVLEGLASRDTPRKTRFQDDIVDPIQLEALKDRVRAGARLTTTKGAFSYGVYGAAGLLRSEPIGFLPKLKVADYSAGLQGAMTFDNDASVAAMVGIHGIDLLDSDFGEKRLAYEVAAATPLPGGFSLRGTLKAGYDLKSNDDPIAVWARRLEAEAGLQVSATVRLGTGVFLEWRDNVGLETKETARGLYAEAAWQAHERLILTLQVDKTRKRQEDFGIERKAVDIQLAMTAKL